MKKAASFLLSIFVTSLLFAQTTGSFKGKITGKVVDSSAGSPLEYATVSIYQPGNKTPLNGTTSDSTGHFALTDISEGTYNVLVEFIGYKPVTLTNITLSKKNENLDIKTIRLLKSQQTLQNIVVTAQGRLIDNKIDKMVYNAERDVTSQTGVATDILKKVPQVSVDVDGNVQLSGSSSIRFLINGKPSTAFGSNIADVLQAIPASQIKSIEVITNPGAKYDAEGLGGIINIILKKSNTRGVNGNLSLSGGTRMENGSFNFNARKGKFGVNAFVSGNYRPVSTTPSVSDRNSFDSTGKHILYHQQGSGQFQRHGFQTGAGFDWNINERNNFSGSVSFNQFGYSGSGIQNQDQTTSFGGNVLSDILSYSHSSSSFRFHNVDASLNYKKTFAKEDQELDVMASSSFGNRFSQTDNYQVLQPQDSMYYGVKSTNPGTQNESQVQIDYTQPLKKDVILGLGGKSYFTDISSSAAMLSLDPSIQEYKYNTYLSNSLRYHQRVYASYAELSFPVFTLFNAKVGGRYERTDISSYYSNTQKPDNSQAYNTFVPSIYLSRKLGDNQSIRLSYSKRISRPGYEDLNPFINTSDPKNFYSGNPLLQPEIGNRFELGYNYDAEKVGSFMVNLFYRTSNHDIQPYITYYPSLTIGDTTYTNVSLSTRENIGLEKNVGVNLYNDLHVIKKLNLRTNVFLFKRYITNVINPGYNATSFNYRLNLNATYNFTGTLLAEFFGNFNSARNEVQGRYPSWTSYSFAIRKQFWNKNGSLALTATNPFGEYVNQKTDVYGPGFNLVSLRQIPFRSFGINFTWKFGKLEFKPEKEKEKENNDNSPVQGS